MNENKCEKKLKRFRKGFLQTVVALNDITLKKNVLKISRL